MDKLKEQASLVIREQLDQIAKVAVDLQYALQSDVWKPYEGSGYTKSLRDSGYHFSYLAESLAANDPALFLEYVAWAKVLFTSLNFPPRALITTLDCMRQALQQNLTPDLAAAAIGYINAASEHLAQAPENIESFISPTSHLYELSTNYLGFLLRGERQAASQSILNAVAQGVSIKDIYLHVFQPCQQELGRLWQTNQISVAQEHFSTAVTQLVMSQLYAYIFASQKNGYRLVATSVGGELHEIGMRMVADFLEMEGWDTYYLGANMPPESILRALEQRQANVLVISATISYHVGKVKELIGHVRSSPACSSVRIMVGGYPFNIAKDLWKAVGADGYARNAQEAVLVANRLVKEAR